MQYSNPTLICNSRSTFSIDIYGNVWSIGENEKGCLGHKKEDDVCNNIIFPFKQISFLVDIKMLSCGYYHTICLDYTGKVFSFGNNISGQLGIGKNILSTHIPQKVNIPIIKQISSGNHFNLCLSEDCNIYSFGSNDYGQLGYNTDEKLSYIPNHITTVKNIELIQCGANFSFCKTFNNLWYSWGSNYFGQLGLKNKTPSSIPILCKDWPSNIISVKCSYSFTILLTFDGNIYTIGSIEDSLLSKKFYSFPTKVPNIPYIKRIECGCSHILCIDIDNNLWVFGKNRMGQLGLNDLRFRDKPILHPTLSNIIDISSGGNHNFVKLANNEIYSFGLCNSFQLGIKIASPIQIIPKRTLINNEEIWISNYGKSKQKSARK